MRRGVSQLISENFTEVEIEGDIGKLLPLRIYIAINNRQILGKVSW